MSEQENLVTGTGMSHAGTGGNAGEIPGGAATGSSPATAAPKVDTAAEIMLRLRDDLLNYWVVLTAGKRADKRPCADLAEAMRTAELWCSPHGPLPGQEGREAVVWGSTPDGPLQLVTVCFVNLQQVFIVNDAALPPSGGAGNVKEFPAYRVETLAQAPRAASEDLAVPERIDDQWWTRQDMVERTSWTDAIGVAAEWVTEAGFAARVYGLPANAEPVLMLTVYHNPDPGPRHRLVWEPAFAPPGRGAIGQTAAPAPHVMETKEWRRDLDAVLQRIKGSARQGRERSLAITKIQEAIMWLGMDLKAQNEPNPYPHSYDPSSPVIEKTADGLKL
ncbi:MAG: hypothetical protein AB1705_15380 [Verrucomicrobiota bacterium]